MAKSKFDIVSFVLFGVIAFALFFIAYEAVDYLSARNLIPDGNIGNALIGVIILYVAWIGRDKVASKLGLKKP